MRAANRLLALVTVSALGLLHHSTSAATELQVVPVPEQTPGYHPCDPDRPELRSALLKAEVNGTDTGLTTVYLLRRCGGVLSRPADLEHIRLKTAGLPIIQVNGHDFISLASIPNLSWQVDEAAAKLLIESDPSNFYPTVLDMAREQPPALSPSASGAFLNYGAFFIDQSDADSSYTGNVGLGLFGGWGTLVSDWIVLDRDDDPFARLNTTYQLDFPEYIASLRVGDAFTRAGTWGSGRPIGGIQLQTNFATRPGMLVSPVQMMEALTARNAVLNLNTRPLGDADARSSPYFYGSLATAPHGPVQVTNLPTFSNGEYELRVRDALGREQTIRQPYYFSQGLLREGLSDYSYELGWVRQGFLTDQYDEEMLSATHRYGLTNQITLEGHLEAIKSRQALGGSMLVSIPWAGVATITAAATRADDQVDTGVHSALSLENRYRRFAYALRHERFSEAFLLPADPSTSNVLQHRSVITGSSQLLANSSVSLSLSDSQFRNNTGFRALRMNFNQRLPRGIQITLFGSQNLEPDENWSTGASLSFPLSALLPQSAVQRYRSGFDPRRTRLNALATTSENQRSVSQLRAHSSLDTLGGFLGVSYAQTLQPETAQTLSASWTNQSVGLLAGVTERPDRTVTTAGLSSALVWIGGRLKPTRSVYNSFALVRLGEDNAGVRVNGRHTDAQGDVLLSPLQPYFDNPVQINATDLPSNVRPNALSTIVNPRFRSGVIIEADLPLIRDALVRILIKDEQGETQPLPHGALVFLAGSEDSFPVGRDGRVYLYGLASSNVISVHWKGRRCALEVTLPEPMVRNQIPELKPLLCSGVRP